jgi:hypothetical protein
VHDDERPTTIAARIRVFRREPVAPTGRCGRVAGPSESPRLAPTPALHPPLLRAIAGLAGIGVMLAAGTAVPAFARLGFWSAVTFAAVAVAGTALAVGVLRGACWAIRTAVAGLAGQPIIALAAAWQLYFGVPASKANELRRLGVRLEWGLAANLAYSGLGVVVFAWLAVRWWRRRNPPRTRPGQGANPSLTSPTREPSTMD